jgi:hypothetical protein
MNSRAVLIVVLVVIVVAVMLVVSYIANQRRQKAFAAWAAQHGYTYAPHDDRFSDLPWGNPFGLGHSREAGDVLTGASNGRPVACFTYSYKTTTSNGKTTQTETHYFSIYSLHLPRALPELRVGREGFFSSVARAIGIHDIEFESEEFNRAFKVKCDDRKFASDVLHPRMMQFLLDTNAPGFTIVGADIVLVDRGRLDLTTVEPNVDYLGRILDSIPEFVWEGP